MKTDLNLRIGKGLYGAYGSNLHIEQMRRRCPGAERVGSGSLDNYRLVFRSVADIEPCAGSRVPIGLWRITPSDERALDRYEGVRLGVYDRVFLPVHTTGRIVEVLLYRMLSASYAPPQRSYLDRILEGYTAWQFDASIVRSAAGLHAATSA